MRLPWVSRRKYDELDLILSHEYEQAEEYMRERDRLKRSHADFLKHNLKLHAARDKANRERDEALARVADLERALGQFSAGEATADTPVELCDCEVSHFNEHRVGFCELARWQAWHGDVLIDSRKLATDCTCPPGWKHRATDCPFNPNPERGHRQRYG